MTRGDPYEPDNLRWGGAVLQAEDAAQLSKSPPRHRPGQWFLRGPVPWPWLEAAARLPGKAPLAVSLCLWREAGRRHRRTVKVCSTRLALGVSEDVARRALRLLACAKLVQIDRRTGRGLEVTLLDVE